MSSLLRDAPPPALQIAGCLSSVARTVHDLGEESFPASLVTALQSLVETDSVLALRYSLERRPAILYDDFQHESRSNSLEAYLGGAYLLDPFFLKATKDKADGVFRLRDIVPADFIMSPYFRMYYKFSHVSDELNFLIQLGEGSIFAISLERISSKIPFNQDDIATLEAMFPLVAELVRADWRLQRRRNNGELRGDERHESLRKRIARFGEDTLSPREREVVQLLLRGYSTREACAALGVTVETVRVHRKNIYRKLEVCSIGGLFSAVLDNMLQHN